ncbi:MAG: hypothetical protein HUU37_08345, partial [Bdellovibrionales bacterium]|nr:hypothetical protein [Bdellovibrionales bacterium]
MKNRILTAALLAAALTATPAPAVAPAVGKAVKTGTSAARSLIRKVERRRKQLQEAELVQFLPSPGTEVPQGGALSLFIRSKTLYSGANVILDAKLDGAAAALSKPANDLWLFASDVFHEIRDHEVRVAVSVEDKELAAQLRASITQADRDIASLERQIALETDPVRRADLVAQRDAKAALRGDLIQSLDALKTPVGEEMFRFRVVKSETGTDYPRITRLSPNYVGQGDVMTIDIFGENFTGAPEVLLAGQTIPASHVAPTRIQFTKPVIASEGIFDVEVRIPQPTGEPKNAILKNALFVRSNV